MGERLDLRRRGIGLGPNDGGIGRDPEGPFRDLAVRGRRSDEERHGYQGRDQEGKRSGGVR
jgi:hypothetical protein